MVGHQLSSSSFFRYQSTVLADTLNRRPISRRLTFSPAAGAPSPTGQHPASGGGPMIFPSTRALSRPTAVRRRVASNSCSEAQAMTLSSVSDRKASGVPGSAAKQEAQEASAAERDFILTPFSPQIPHCVHRVHPVPPEALPAGSDVAVSVFHGFYHLSRTIRL